MLLDIRSHSLTMLRYIFTDPYLYEIAYRWTTILHKTWIWHNISQDQILHNGKK